MTSFPHIHVIGAGLAGLSTALHLGMLGHRVTLYEAGQHAGGRCRSYFDRELGCRIDNGNHLILSGNLVTRDYLFFSDAEDTMTMADAPVFPFMDLRSGARWTIRMTKGKIPWWLLSPRKRVPGTELRDYVSALKLQMARPEETVAQVLGQSYPALTRRFWEPLTVAALNTEPGRASARMLASIFAQTFGAGGQACLPMIPKHGLSESLVDPCLKKLKNMGVEIKFGQRLRAFGIAGQTVTHLDFGAAVIKLTPQDWVVLAVPPWVAQELLPEITAPTEFRAIVNAHYRIDVPRNEAGFTGLVGGIAEWVFVKPGIASVTVSAADRYIDTPAPELAATIWRDIARLYRLNPDAIPPHRIVKEKRATFAATPQQLRQRPRAFTQWHNLALAGDWTATELPSTIEGAIRSGLKAAQMIARWVG